MADAHFTVNTVEGVLIFACGKVAGPRDVKGARIGIYGQICSDCERVVKQAWVTVP